MKSQVRLGWWVVLTIAALTAIRLFVAAGSELFPQEAYYWTYSLHPAWGYYDHPPFVAWVAAAKVAGLACAVPYYGGGIPNHSAEQPQCPVMFQFGEQDQMPSAEQARAIAAAHPTAVAHFYDAGHGFNCDQRGSYDAAASKLARSRTLEFLAQHVG
jgi:pimeloyl-ACP methyl ester carboxylesterase